MFLCDALARINASRPCLSRLPFNPLKGVGRRSAFLYVMHIHPFAAISALSAAETASAIMKFGIDGSGRYS
jgi:hypothetical protein